MEQIICAVGENERAYVAWAFVAWQVLEFWLGKTNKTQSGSTLEFVFNFLKLLKAKVFGQQPKE